MNNKKKETNSKCETSFFEQKKKERTLQWRVLETNVNELLAEKKEKNQNKPNNNPTNIKNQLNKVELQKKRQQQQQPNGKKRKKDRSELVKFNTNRC